MYTKDTTKSYGQDLHNKDLHNDFLRIKEKARETRDAISQAASDVKDRAQDLWSQSIRDAKTKSSDVQDQVVTYVRANPVKSVGLAVLSGLFVAWLMRK